MEVTIKRNDTKVKFKDWLKLKGVAVPLNGLNEGDVLFVMRQLYERTPKIVEADATLISQDITGPNVGYVEYEVAAEDVNTMGDFRQEWEVTFTDGRPLSFPNGSYNLVHIISDLNPPP